MRRSAQSAGSDSTFARRRSTEFASTVDVTRTGGATSSTGGSIESGARSISGWFFGSPKVGSIGRACTPSLDSISRRSNPSETTGDASPKVLKSVSDGVSSTMSSRIEKSGVGGAAGG